MSSQNFLLLPRQIKYFIYVYTCKFAEVGAPFETMFTYTGNLVYLEHAVVVMTVGVNNGRRGDLYV